MKLTYGISLLAIPILVAAQTSQSNSTAPFKLTDLDALVLEFPKCNRHCFRTYTLELFPSKSYPDCSATSIKNGMADWNCMCFNDAIETKEAVLESTELNKKEHECRGDTLRDGECSEEEDEKAVAIYNSDLPLACMAWNGSVGQGGSPKKSPIDKINLLSSNRPSTQNGTEPKKASGAALVKGSGAGGMLGFGFVGLVACLAYIA
ncbi:hypothetical protein BJ508DRAFT_417387 [Ascobolus immersus RN42]|uniref:Extracellular membrane protein CFEM domain-containing protein n=1 Tax=Ascobolus immersus RN42 TaxID=1160509 RepID=A0A3N4HWK1_ASCIM|nr:hypothetical protein BJ508DRAFT_417387 [Ascobolus immersus RN42]